MKTLLAAVLATVIVAPCMAANENQEDKTPGDAATPGVNEPRTPDTLKSAPDQRIQSEGRASEEGTVGEKNRALDEKKVPNEKRDEEKK
jgi:hypothetical protein